MRTFFCCIIVICFFNISKEVIWSSCSWVSLTSSFCRLSQYFCSVNTSELRSSICLVSLLTSISNGPNSCPWMRARLSHSACSILPLSVFLDLIMLSYLLPEYWCHLIFSSGTDNSLQTSALGTPSFCSSSLCQLLFACIKNCLTNINSYIN